MASVAVIGTGYVGLTTAVGMAELGHDVVGVDIDPTKVETLQKGKLTIHEAGLDDMLVRALTAGKLHFTTAYADAVPHADFIFIAVATPMGRNGEPNLKALKMAARDLARAMTRSAVLVLKSTV